MDDKLALRISQAGMRFIAQMTIYNSGDFERLHRYIVESYHPDLLASEGANERMVAFREQQGSIGKVKVQQVIGMGKHHVMVLVETEFADGYFLNDLSVEEDYPHRIIDYSVTPVE